jgi:hypothetical protein
MADPDHRRLAANQDRHTLIRADCEEVSDELDEDRLRQRYGLAHHIRVCERGCSIRAQRLYLSRYGENILAVDLGRAGGSTNSHPKSGASSNRKRSTSRIAI